MEQARRDIATDYTHDRNTLIRDVAARVEDRIGLEIGDSKSGEFIPQAKILRWDNEVNFSIRRDNGARSFVERDGKIVAEGFDENVVIYELEPDEQNEDGGLEIEIELPRRPKTNVFEFTLETKGLNFYYQPELTEEEKAEGTSRPDNIIGSYAVYHATKRDNRVGGKHYKTGKAFHIYRPKAIDADGAEVWCELNIDEQAGVLTVTVPQDWLNRASYPVRVDPTFGYTSVGASQKTFGPGRAYLATGSPTVGGLVSKISVYMGLNSADLKGALWLKSDGTLIANGVTAANTARGAFDWQDMTYGTQPSVAGVSDYYVGVVSGNVTSTTIGFYDTGEGGRDNTNNYDTPQNLGVLDSTTDRHSIYATYTPSGVFIEASSCAADPGFANIDTPADTSPFNSGDQVSYTVQAADELTAGTYYWRVRGRDPSGSDTFGDWTASRTFTVSFASGPSPIKVKVAGTFASATAKVKVGGTFVTPTPQIKSGGTFG